jgi:hypothetical protein
MCALSGHTCALLCHAIRYVTKGNQPYPASSKRRKSVESGSLPWIDLAVLAGGHSHYWFFEPSCDVNGWVFQATAHPEQLAGEEARLEVTELFIVRNGDMASGSGYDRINITVTNCASGWAPYSLWVASVSPSRRLAVATTAVSRRIPQGGFSPGFSAEKQWQLLLVHDEFGNIKSAAVPARVLALRAGLRTREGELITELTVPDFELEQLRRNPRGITQDFRIDTAASALIRRN